MRLHSSLTSLLSLIVILTIGTVTNVAARQAPPSVEIETSRPIEIETNKKVELEVPQNAEIETSGNVIVEDANVMNKTDTVLKSVVHGATYQQIVDDIHKYNLSLPIDQVVERMVEQAIGSKENPKIVAGTNVTVKEILGNDHHKLAEFVQKQGADICVLLQEIAMGASASAEMATKADLQAPLSKLYTSCIHSFVTKEKAMLDAAEKLRKATEPFHNKETLSAADEALLKTEFFKIAEEYRDASAQEEAAVETDGTPRLQKRAFVTKSDVETIKKTIRSPVDEIVHFAKGTARLAIMYVSFKFVSGVFMRNTLQQGGQQGAWKYWKSEYQLADNEHPNGLNPFQMTYDYMVERIMEGANPFKLVGAYTVSGVPALSMWGGGPNMTYFPEHARPLFANMCQSLAAAQRWQLGTTIHPDSPMNGGWCRSTVLVHIDEEPNPNPRSKVPTIIRSQPLRNLEIRRRHIGTLSTLLETIMGIQPGYAWVTLGSILWAGVKLWSGSFGIMAVAPMVAIAYSPVSLTALPGLAATKVKEFAIAAASTKAWNMIPSSLRQAFNVGSFFKNKFGGKSAAKTERVVLPREHEKAQEANLFGSHDNDEEEEENVDEDDIFVDEPEFTPLKTKLTKATVDDEFDEEDDDLNGSFDDEYVDDGDDVLDHMRYEPEEAYELPPSYADLSRDGTFEATPAWEYGLDEFDTPTKQPISSDAGYHADRYPQEKIHTPSVRRSVPAATQNGRIANYWNDFDPMHAPIAAI